ncbi:uncharacterized protein CcaverHIS019_0209890 [Cutaneotrichosporon cavernicola]|uniref:Uncharacterized protein n=1 Tax=Cutaneotrichosporon cavernicola TaxID=279322 RepID=A0AA48IB91_9TREE|nr:uncharacterized protein CcaverHIS019_0209890 [Cutaneotrichosporon cavernicola]BEI89627.1 hypothetical protein CcaverHIS019_0209890 [Cutaneotrichosporon cavernicola]
MARDQPWRDVLRVICKLGWVRKYPGKGNGSAHEPWVHPVETAVLNIPKHGRDGLVKAVYIQQIINLIGWWHCPDSWLGGRTFSKAEYEKLIKEEDKSAHEEELASEAHQVRRCTGQERSRKRSCPSSRSLS